MNLFQFIISYFLWAWDILPWLVNQANRQTKSPEWYAIKNKILIRFGEHIGYDVQFLGGKKCHGCNGTGRFTIYYSFGSCARIECNRCDTSGWYKLPAWVLLQRIKLKKYIFHKPIQKEHRITNPFTKELGCNVTDEVIIGYIEHKATKFGRDALLLLYLMFDWKGYWKRWWKRIGRGWYFNSIMKPRYWPNNIAHIIRHRHNSMPFHYLRNFLKSKSNDADVTLVFGPPNPGTDDLPF